MQPIDPTIEIDAHVLTLIRTYVPDVRTFIITHDIASTIADYLKRDYSETVIDTKTKIVSLIENTRLTLSYDAGDSTRYQIQWDETTGKCSISYTPTITFHFSLSNLQITFEDSPYFDVILESLNQPKQQTKEPEGVMSLERKATVSNGKRVPHSYYTHSIKI